MWSKRFFQPSNQTGCRVQHVQIAITQITANATRTHLIVAVQMTMHKSKNQKSYGISRQWPHDPTNLTKLIITVSTRAMCWVDTAVMRARKQSGFCWCVMTSSYRMLQSFPSVIHFCQSFSEWKIFKICLRILEKSAETKNYRPLTNII